MLAAPISLRNKIEILIVFLGVSASLEPTDNVRSPVVACLRKGGYGEVYECAACWGSYLPKIFDALPAFVERVSKSGPRAHALHICVDGHGPSIQLLHVKQAAVFRHSRSL